MTREEIFETYPFEEFLFADGWDDAIIGVSNDMKIVYDSEKIIEMLSQDMSYDEAMEYFYFNIEGAYVGEKTPIYVNTLMY